MGLIELMELMGLTGLVGLVRRMGLTWWVGRA